MAVTRSAWLMSLLLIQAACAAHDGRETAAGGAPAPSRGWIEVTVADGGVPADPVATLAGRPAQPPVCTLEVELDGTTFLSEQLRPSGASPPYSVQSTFQFPVAAGDYAAGVTYSGCRSVGRQQDSVRAEVWIPVRDRQTTRIRFDGARLEAEFPADAAPAPASP